MTDTDFLEQQREQINDRIAELEPSVVEYNRLKAAGEALAGIPPSKNGAAASAPARRRPGRPRRSDPIAAAPDPRATKTPKARATAKTGRRTTGRRKGSGKRALQALVFIQEQPGITIPELAAKMGTHQTYLYKVVPRLEQDGRIRKEGRGWHPTAKILA